MVMPRASYKTHRAPFDLGPTVRVSGVTARQRVRETDKTLFTILALITSVQLMLPWASFLLWGERAWHVPWMVALNYFLAFTSAVVIVSRFRRISSLTAWPVLTLEVLLAIRLSIHAGHEGVVAADLIVYSVTAAVFLALWLLSPDVEWLVVFAYVGLFLAAVSLIWTVLDPNSAFAGSKEPVNIWQAVIKNKSLWGPFGNPNALGIALALSFPFTFLIKNRAFRYWSAAMIFLPLILSNSRTSTIAAIVAFLLLMFLTHSKAVDSIKTVIVTWAMVLAALTTLLVPIMLAPSPRSFSGRGRLWDAALRAWEASPIFGNGFSWHPRGLGSPHNVPMQLLARGGLVWSLSVLAVLTMMILIARRRAAAGCYVPAAYVVSFLLVFLAESSVSLLVGDPWFGLTGFAIAALLTGQLARNSAPVTG